MSNLIKILNPATSRLALLLTRALRSVTTTLLLLSAWSTTSTTFAATIPAPYELATWRGFSASAVSYTFDDNSPNQFSVAQPMFDAKGLHATFFCIVGGTPDWTAITNASAKGHEIGNHTLTHPNLSSETDAQVIAEEGGAKTLIEAHTGKKCVSLAYPYCAPPNELITSQFCSFARSCNGSLVPITPSDFLSIGSMGPDVDMNAASENAASSGSWLVWLIHGIDNDAACCPIASSVLKANLDYVSTFPDDWWIETFGNVCRYIQERNAAVLTVVSIDAAHITIQLTHNLDNTIFNYPLTLRRPMPSGWATAAVTQNGVSVPSHVVNGKLMFDVVPNGGDIVMSNPNAPQGQTTNIGADDPNIQYVGRFDRTTPTAPGFDWSLSTIRAKFQGTSCSVKLDGNRKFFDVFIDGVKTTTPIISVSSGLETFQVATGLSNTVHSVSICRRTEGANGKNTFQGFVLDSGKALVSPDPGPIRKIAFIGDSYTCGYGDEAPSVEAPAADANENACITYAALMARHYNADCMITAWSGKGMVRNYGDANQTSPDPLPTVYPRTCASVASNDYAFDWQPDVVVIALGINDFSTTPHPSEQQFVGGYVSFIQTLRSHYPKAHILCTYWTNMDPVGSGYIAEAASASGDSKVHFANVNCPLNYPADYGSNWHPNASGHTKIANAFIPVFDSIMGPTWGKSIYAFEGNSLDTSGNGNDGTANALTYVPGKIGAQAAQFNGTSSNVSIPRSVTDDFTVAMWVKTTDTAGSAGGQWWSGKGLVDGEVWGGAADWGTSIVNGQFVLGVGSSSGDV
ncbi:MAG TPA: polysaccharide deacetylase family protein, partial [Bryobacteraceae bacterium]|nr:polysaccharide deacetylase family protein [Bryobacteraceae bacterium]